MAAQASSNSNATATSELQSSLRELALTNKSPVKDIARPSILPPSALKKKKAAPVADSWEDEIDESASESDDLDNKSATISRDDLPVLSPSIRASEDPLDPPPTPLSPQTSLNQPWPSYGNAGSVPRSSDSKSPVSGRRPEKQTAVANRLIAGALGIRAPKRTEEQRAYDRAVKEQEIKRRNKEREEAAKAREEEEKAKAAVWDA
ncbi:uncharacterized protein BP01DRAFT_422433 [Aspergillus saccharolyticus JOP 1030-1]|uniref:Ubiquitin-like protein smt3 n=1 Tax=Aspergillus saccharolyticus JOP 1030-1 TaxID=1450539 RepID=A0A318ZR67_9EURO|nr:hypothetical protein BP01DRAFT_422433 [Aspergillus saccharolyticus JOP 1030-1]PYH46440.1 hypothetical protein BP01DRAFT_422433 [Aspergillus saccharolyticus JOP 1030-1]